MWAFSGITRVDFVQVQEHCITSPNNILIIESFDFLKRIFQEEGIFCQVYKRPPPYLYLVNFKLLLNVVATVFLICCSALKATNALFVCRDPFLLSNERPMALNS
jgi:hypothetical protein